MVLLTGLLAFPPVFSETQGYVVHMFHHATYAHPDNCPNGGNGSYPEREFKILRALGYSDEDLLYKIDRGKRKLLALERGTINNQPVNAITYPESAPDPGIETVAGPFAYGFDLDGKQTDPSSSFTDPETKTEGVDNQTFRVVGCYPQFNVSLPLRPQADHGQWEIMAETMPVWLFSVSADDLSEDGPVTVTFYRAVQHMRRNAMGQPLADATYVVDPGSRSEGTFRGFMKQGTLNVESNSLILEGEQPLLHELDLTQSRFRLTLDSAARTANGWLGGYIPWRNLWYLYSAIGAHHMDEVGVYYALQRLADGPPDSETGERTRISVTYRIEATEVFIILPETVNPALFESDTRNVQN
jgi:hypothetical protein